MNVSENSASFLFLKKYNLNQLNTIDKENLILNLVGISTVNKTVTGGRKMRFIALSVAGNKKGYVGIGRGKDKDIKYAISKSFEYAKKNLKRIPITSDTFSIPFPKRIKYRNILLVLKPARLGKGIIAGGVIRIYLELAGYKNLSVKIVDNRKTRYNCLKAIETALQRMNEIIYIRKLRRQKIIERLHKK